ncbi:hypothetical protein IF2G_09736 [Cordyceps javanica]|nr:hypothetical protein IF2G_09736 [Cordyceps javanica]
MKKQKKYAEAGNAAQLAYTLWLRYPKYSNTDIVAAEWALKASCGKTVVLCAV